MDESKKARGHFFRRVLSSLLLLPAWFGFHKSIRVFFHRMRGVKIGKNVEIGYFCIIGNVHPYNIFIEDDVVVTAGCVLLDHDNSSYYAHGGEVVLGEVHIKRRAFVGLKSIIMPGVTIGEASIVAPLSFVNKDVLPFTLVGGIPAKFIKAYDDRASKRDSLCEIT